ncbi:hypothetical protein SAMN02982990_02273 [Photorhabdus luminescens]|uniref:Uncharacterized protein n=1 Tax=Photorhabdus luminescens TaxID=29488 RepID=A0A1G5QSH6_PHOLU|nr:hypothetical protein SAMN02982990_02273 [Photorhabdus luminescens]
MYSNESMIKNNNHIIINEITSQYDFINLLKYKTINFQIILTV